MAFSSWAFVILGLPILVAYGIVAGVPWYFYPLLPLFLLGFVLLPGSVSALVCLLLVPLPAAEPQAGAALRSASSWCCSAGCGWCGRRRRPGGSLILTNQRDELEGLIGQFELVRSPLVPSHWMTTGIMAAARGEPGEALLPLALIWSNGLLAYLVAACGRRGGCTAPAFDRHRRRRVAEAGVPRAASSTG